MTQCIPSELFKEIISKISSTYAPDESQAIAYEILEVIFRLTKTDLVINQPVKLTTQHLNKLNDIIQRLLEDEPIQYILHKAHFYGREYYVNTDVLIPRQETESLIELVKNWQLWKAPNILDIGVGSGCIACSLALEISHAQVFGIDISEGALEVSRKNAKALQAKVSFANSDVLNEDIRETNLDIIVSNPPYVRELEKAEMNPNVLMHEPDLALFVSDGDPLLFYDAIMAKSKKALKSGGFIFFEINEAFGKEMIDLLQSHGYHDATIHQDLHGKDRFTSAQWLA